jgi:hypothetical protein
VKKTEAHKMAGIFKIWNDIGAKKWFPYLLLVAIGTVIAVVARDNEMWDGGGDNYWHYYFSKYAFRFPKFFLHHWGKPFFILLTCVVTQFGFYALNIFNIVCGLLSALIAYKWCKKMGFGYSTAAILVVVISPVYLSIMNSGLTEPLFSLLVIYSAYLLYFEKYTWACLVISTLPFSRSEGMFILLIFMVYIIIVRKFKHLPLLAVAFVFYGLLGLLAGKNFLWYFTENPYAVVSQYGHGTYTHFITRYDFTFGAPYVIAFFVGTLIIGRNIILNKEFYFWKLPGKNFKLFYLSFIPTMAFFLFHVYAWGAGKFASAGLERVMGCVIPIGAMMCMVSVNMIHRINFRIVRSVLIIVFLYFSVNAPFIYYRYPIKAYGPEKAVREAASWFVKVREPGSRIFYTHSGIVFFADYDPYDPLNSECMNFPLEEDCTQKSAPGKFYYFWDNRYTPSACGVNLETLENCPKLRKMKEFSDWDFKIVVFETI